ncbi:MAG: hypothetical protein K0S08_610 [Gammaproteobacteria bacterium]|jgi:hypothetical protein|nr:hypothetical protein [Gammaproteobacteria bacterium]
MADIDVVENVIEKIRDHMVEKERIEKMVTLLERGVAVRDVVHMLNVTPEEVEKALKQQEEKA